MTWAWSSLCRLCRCSRGARASPFSLCIMPTSSMRILITNAALMLRAGTEAFVQDLGVALTRAGHDVAVYSNIGGDVAASIRASGIPVMTDLDHAPWVPDV